MYPYMFIYRINKHWEIPEDNLYSKMQAYPISSLKSVDSLYSVSFIKQTFPQLEKGRLFLANLHQKLDAAGNSSPGSV